MRCDCTTRNRNRRIELHEHVDEMEERIAELAEEDRRARERPAIDGQRVMDILGIEPGPVVGEALSYLLAAKRAGSGADTDTAERLLKEWWNDRSP